MNDDISDKVKHQFHDYEFDVSEYLEWKSDNRKLLRLNVAVLVVSILSLFASIVAIIRA